MAVYSHSEALDFSVGSENRILIKFEGWTDDLKRRIMADIQLIDGVTKTNATGGNTGAYIYFDPNEVDRQNLHDTISRIARSPDYDHKTGPATFALSDMPVEQFGVGVSTDPNASVSDTNQVDSSASTGVATARLKLREVSVLIPSTMHFVDALIGQAEMYGHNGGPETLMPQDIEQLRPLHTALGELLEMSEAKDWDDQRFEGLIADIGRFIQTVQSNLADDKPYASGLAMISVIIGMINPLAGASLAAGGMLAKGMKGK